MAEPNSPDPVGGTPTYVVGQPVVQYPQGVAGQPVVAGQTPVIITQPVPTPAPVPQAGVEVESRPTDREVVDNFPELRIISHSRLFYWWPVWVIGFVMAFVTHFVLGEPHLSGAGEGEHLPNSDLGVIFFLTLFMVILFTNVTVRGLASGMVILGAVTTVVVLAYFRLWDPILSFFGNLNIYMNSGAYFWFSSLMFLAWFFSVFIFDRMSFWKIKPGQITQVVILGSASRTYDTRNMIIEKFRDDLFRHWILGLGSGDIRIETSGAHREHIFLPNVLFVGRKINQIQNLVKIQPELFGQIAIK